MLCEDSVNVTELCFRTILRDPFAPFKIGGCKVFINNNFLFTLSLLQNLLRVQNSLMIALGQPSLTANEHMPSYSNPNEHLP